MFAAYLNSIFLFRISRNLLYSVFSFYSLLTLCRVNLFRCLLYRWRKRKRMKFTSEPIHQEFDLKMCRVFVFSMFFLFVRLCDEWRITLVSYTIDVKLFPLFTSTLIEFDGCAVQWRIQIIVRLICLISKPIGSILSE